MRTNQQRGGGEQGALRVFDGVEVDLKNRYVAAVLAYLVPGAGHYYQGRKQKAKLYAICILGLFIVGYFLGSGRVVYAYENTFKLTNLPKLLTKSGRASLSGSRAPEFRIHAYAQAMVGVPAFPMIFQSFYGQRTPDQQLLGGFMAPPPSGSPADGVNPDWLAKWHNDGSASFDLGSLYTAIAGLLNLLVIMDAFAGPMPVPVTPSRKS